jgi:hypothetical protein
VKTRHPHLTLAAAALALTACGPSQPVGNNVVSASPAASTSATASARLTPKPTAPAHRIGPGDFTLAAKILKQDCFASAGCNVTYRVQVLKSPAAGSFEVTYDVQGVEDGPRTGSVTIDDGKYDDAFLEDLAQVKHRVKGLKVVVTSVENRS